VAEVVATLEEAIAEGDILEGTPMAALISKVTPITNFLDTKTIGVHLNPSKVRGYLLTNRCNRILLLHPDQNVPWYQDRTSVGCLARLILGKNQSMSRRLV
jgi:hypothetical protein